MDKNLLLENCRVEKANHIAFYCTWGSGIEIPEIHIHDQDQDQTQQWESCVMGKIFWNVPLTAVEKQPTTAEHSVSQITMFPIDQITQRRLAACCWDTVLQIESDYIWRQKIMC